MGSHSPSRPFVMLRCPQFWSPGTPKGQAASARTLSVTGPFLFFVLGIADSPPQRGSRTLAM
jgi:hypothetical protein